MANPLLIGGLVMGGAIAAWRLVRERGRIRRMVEKLSRESTIADSPQVIPLERDPETGVYVPRKKR